MKLRAIRLAEVGRFSGPVALEGLSDGLNVLADANEAGKSTILAALRMAFEQSHKTAHRAVEALRPYGGGAPLVEVDFTLGTDTWRLRKQYLAGRSAELRHLGNGQVSRGADAEEHLIRLLEQAAGGSALSMLWAGQKQALTPAPPNAGDAAGLRRAIAAEIAATVGGSEARAVRDVVRSELKQYLTAHDTPRPKGDWDAAQKLCTRLEQDMALAVARRDAALSRLDRLGELKAAEAELSDPGRVAATFIAAASAEAALVAAREALQKQRLAAEAVTAAESRLDLVRSKSDALAADLRNLKDFAAAIALDQDACRDTARARADAETTAAEARVARDGARHAVTLLDRELKDAIEAERRQEARERQAELATTLAAVDEATAAGLALKAQLDTIDVTPDLLRAARTEEGAIRRLEDRLAAATPRLTIAYAPGAAGGILSGGAPLADGPHKVDRPLILTIPGIGTIEIAPGASEGAAATEAALSAHREALANLLSGAAVTNLAEAEERLVERQRLEAEIGEARARLAALLPAGGVPRLRAEIEALEQRVSADAGADARAREVIEAETEGARQALRAAEVTDEAAQRVAAKTREADVLQAAASAERVKGLAALEEKLPKGEAREALSAELAAATAACERALHAAVRDMNAWRDQAPDAVRLQQLEAEAARTAEAQRQDDRKREETRRSIASLEGELRVDRNDEVEARVAECEGALAVARRSLSRLAEEVAALQLLDGELRAEEVRSQDQYLRPITARLAPLVDLVFPGADIALAESFVPHSLRRAGTAEDICALSEGTQEQLAVMVRLAFGRLMADAGHPVPVILDDALVYSDDERILSMFRALITSARHHQVIAFTCRSRAFACLEAHPLKIVPWQPETVAIVPRQLAAG
jgi:hypothetical protein